ncbi:MAG TPA: amidase [Chloroflexota bacterium]
MYTVEQSGAFVSTFELEPLSSGSLDGLRFAVKDLIDVAGRTTGCGNPTWRDTHPPAVINAPVVDQLLRAGARCAGKTVTDELAFSLAGENHFYGTPLNPRAPDRVPGGSSSGSASAVACGLVDFALGTDTGGSVRIPANNCGLFGLRPSHGLLSVAGVMPFAPTFDAVGVLASSAPILSAAARVLLACEEPENAAVGTIHLITEGFAGADPEVRAALSGPLEILRGLYGNRVRETSLRAIDGVSDADGFAPWSEAFYPVQWGEIWSTLGSWIEEHHPSFGPRTERNFALTKGVDRSEMGAAIERRERLARSVQRFLGPNDLLCIPTAPALPPVKGSLPLDRGTGGYYSRTVAQISVSGIGRLPQVTMPLAESAGVPVGLSLLAGYGRDGFLLDVMTDIVKGLNDSG